MEDLKMGAAILKEYIDVETEKQERVDKAKKSEKAAKEAAAERVSHTSLIFDPPDPQLD